MNEFQKETLHSIKMGFMYNIKYESTINPLELHDALAYHIFSFDRVLRFMFTFFTPCASAGDLSSLRLAHRRSWA